MRSKKAVMLVRGSKAWGTSSMLSPSGDTLHEFLEMDDENITMDRYMDFSGMIFWEFPFSEKDEREIRSDFGNPKGGKFRIVNIVTFMEVEK